MIGYEFKYRVGEAISNFEKKWEAQGFFVGSKAKSFSTLKECVDRSLEVGFYMPLGMSAPSFWEYGAEALKRADQYRSCSVKVNREYVKITFEAHESKAKVKVTKGNLQVNSKLLSKYDMIQSFNKEVGYASTLKKVLEGVNSGRITFPMASFTDDPELTELRGTLFEQLRVLKLNCDYTNVKEGRGLLPKDGKETIRYMTTLDEEVYMCDSAHAAKEHAQSSASANPLAVCTYGIYIPIHKDCYNS